MEKEMEANYKALEAHTRAVSAQLAGFRLFREAVVVSVTAAGVFWVLAGFPADPLPFAACRR